MDFNTQVVSHYRLLGYENHRIDDERFLDDAVDVGEIGADHSVPPLYKLKLHDDADGPPGKVFVRYQEPDSNQVVDLSRTVTRGELSSGFPREALSPAPPVPCGERIGLDDRRGPNTCK